MTDWMKPLFGEMLSPAMSYMVLFAAVILGIFILLWIARKLLGGTFVSGGRGRHLRLAVMDATPVDSRRRLVLVRRDEVEHLILIGGPTDVVVEQNIRHNTARDQTASPSPVAPVAEAFTPVVQSPRMEPSAPAAKPLELRPRPQVQPSATPMPPRPVMPPPTTRYAGASVSAAAPAATQPPQRPVFPPLVPAPAPPQTTNAPILAGTAGAAAVAAAPFPPVSANASPTKPVDNEIDEGILADLTESLGLDDAIAPEVSLEKEMESLLGTLDPKKDRLS